MAAYLIVSATVTDRERFLRDYAAAAAQLVAQFGGRYVLRGPGAQLLEGGFGDGGSIVISEWADKAAVLSFWNSPEYQEVKKQRDGIADVQVLLIEAPQINGAK